METRQCCAQLGTYVNLCRLDSLCLIGHTGGMGTKKLEVGALQHEAVALIREAMSRGGVSGRAVADRAGVTVSRCAAILRNERVMTVDEFVAIAGVLGLTPWRLLREAEARLAAEADK